MKYFGTDGIRGRVSELLTQEFVERMGHAIATYKQGIKSCVIGCDTRESSSWIVETLSGVLSGYDIKNYFIGVVPTAAVAYMAKHLEVDVGIMITASHNPYEWNGIKLFGVNGEKLDKGELEKVEIALDKKSSYLSSSPNDGFSLLTLTTESWWSFLVSNFSTLISRKNIDKPFVFLDCANGSGGETAKKVLRLLGFRYRTINNNPNGRNINEKCGATNISSLVKMVKAYAVKNPSGEVVGFAFDGDADRCVAVTKEGEVAGERLLVALAKHIGVEQLASTILFNKGAEDYLKDKGINLVKTKVGDKYVLQAVKEQNMVLGGEPNGHIVLPRINVNGDGLITLLMTLRMVVESGKSLYELTKDIPIYPSINLNLKATATQKAAIDGELFTSFIQELKSQNPEYKIIVRPSGTEDLVRITAEGQNEDKCKEIANIIGYQFNHQ